MFDNATKLTRGAGTDVPTAIIDGPTNGRTMRSSADGTVQLSIAHNESNENPGFVTQRINVRVNQDFVLDDTDKTVKAYAQLTISSPKGAVTAAEAADIVAMLINFVTLGENSAGNTSVDNTNMPITVARLLAGEP